MPVVLESVTRDDKHRFDTDHLPFQLYGNLEWTFKWLKILLILGVCIVMIAIKAGGEDFQNERAKAY